MHLLKVILQQVYNCEDQSDYPYGSCEDSYLPKSLFDSLICIGAMI